ncbi:MAG: protein kinase [Deltaproteobacteria bacterium]|nr:protein kinase [Deltaproteobacteria bacterium]
MSQASPISLGPFDLIAPFGQGGMASVWRGEHRSSGLPVAVKVLEGSLAIDSMFKDAFAAEVRAVVGLDHPGVVLVFDHGQVPAEAAAQSSGKLSEGAPYLVMEFASGGTLLDHPPGNWPALRNVLTSVLDSLAHAHARGVVHRDIKGGNVLLCAGSDLRPGWKLSDFGLALPVGGDEVEDIFEDTAVGTPPYMAPEQFTGDARLYGPWTDLYSLACLTFLLTTGKAPFGKGNPAEMARAHRELPVPPWKPLISLPVALEDWLGRLLEKDPWDRYQSAAEALRDLWAIDGSQVPSSVAPRNEPSVEMGPILSQAPALSTVIVELSEPMTSVPVPRSAERVASEQAERAVPFPTTWRLPDGRPDPIQLQGAGLGLLALRRTGVVGREAHRDRMWEALGRVCHGNGAELILLHGDPGQGKSRLAQWLEERSSELGVAHTLSARFGRTGGSGEGLGAMLVRHLGLQTMSWPMRREEVRRHLARLGGDPSDVDSLMTLMSPLDEETVAGLARTTPEQRFAALLRLIGAEGRRLPVVLWLDDLHFGPEGVAFAEHVLERAHPGGPRVLLVGTSWTEPIGKQDATGAVLRGLIEKARARDLPVRPLSEESQRKLLASLLSLEPGLADEVNRRAEGNPLFAIQMLGDLAERGVLEAGAQGFTLIAGARSSLPRDIYTLWQRRVERVVQPLGRTALAALEVAAALGERVERAEWIASCARAQLALPERLEAALLDGGLAQPDESGWSFSHGLLRESIERAARLEGRWEGWNNVCADALYALPGNTAGPRLERIGRHKMQAREWASAFRVLTRAAAVRTVGDDVNAGLRIIDLAEEALEKLGVPPSDRRRGVLLAARADAELMVGDVQAAVDAAHDLSQLAREYYWPEKEGQALLVLGQVQLREYRSAEGLLLLRKALEYLERTTMAEAVERAMRLLARALSHEKQFDAARQMADRALASARTSEDDKRIGEAMQVKAALHRDLRQPIEAEQWTRRAAEHFVHSGHHVLVADTYSSLGEARREAGDLVEAKAWFLRARDQWRKVGSKHEVMGDLCAAGVDMEAKNPREGLETVRRVLPMIQPGGYFEAVCWILFLQGATLTGDWSDGQFVVERLEDLAGKRQLANPEFIEVIRDARMRALKDGQIQVGSRLLKLEDTVSGR